MNHHLRRELLAALRLLLLLTALTGLAYPLAITGLAALLFPAASGGSLVRDGDRIVASRLVGQHTAAPGAFWGRPSATAPVPTTALDLARRTAGTGSNLAASNPALLQTIADRVAALHAAERAAGVADDGLVPVDLATASASGLDPHLSVAAARYQVPRIAAVRRLPPQRLLAAIDACRQGGLAGWFGPPIVDVGALNRTVAAMAPR